MNNTKNPKIMTNLPLLAKFKEKMDGLSTQ